MEEKAIKSDETGEWMVIERRKKSVLAAPSTKRQSSQSLNILKKAPNGKGKQNNENKGGITAPPSTYSKIFGEKDRRVTNQTSEKISEIKLPPKDVVVVSKAAETKDITKPLQITKKDEKTASKPKKKIALFDVLLASTTAHQQPPPSTRDTKLPSEGKPKSMQLHSNALRNLETVFEPKKFVQVEDEGQKKRKRKKQMSTFKKKILRVS